MIASFADRATEDLFHGRRAAARQIPPSIHAAALRKLDMLNGAHQLLDLTKPPGNRLEALKGDRRGEHSIRINDQWRITFRWDAGQVHAVRIEDYH